MRYGCSCIARCASWRCSITQTLSSCLRWFRRRSNFTLWWNTRAEARFLTISSLTVVWKRRRLGSNSDRWEIALGRPSCGQGDRKWDASEWFSSSVDLPSEFTFLPNQFPHGYTTYGCCCHSFWALKIQMIAYRSRFVLSLERMYWLLSRVVIFALISTQWVTHVRWVTHVTHQSFVVAFTGLQQCSAAALESICAIMISQWQPYRMG